MSDQKEEKKVVEIPTVKLNTGAAMPMLGLGTWQAEKGLVGAAVKHAIETGYTHIDAAAVYGNEKEVGTTFAEAFSSGVDRKSIFVTSKLWNSEHAPEHVEAACKQTLADLQLDYLDLYLIHWPQSFQHTEGSTASFAKNEDGTMKYDLKSSLLDTWGAMEKLVKAGLVRAIGLSNFNTSQIEEVVKGGSITPAVLQVERHPFFVQEGLRQVCAKHGVVMTGYSPLGTGKEIAGHTIPVHPALVAIGKKYNKTAAQVAIRWQIQTGVVVIPKSVKTARIEQNFDVLDFVLSEEDLQTVSALDANFRSGWGGPQVEREGKQRPRDEVHPNYPFTMASEGGQNDAKVF